MRKFKNKKIMAAVLALLLFASAAGCDGKQENQAQTEGDSKLPVVVLDQGNSGNESPETSSLANPSRSETGSEEEGKFFCVNPDAQITEESKTPEAQLQLFCDNYTEIRRDVAGRTSEENPDGDIMFRHLAVADFNRNGRLDFLVSSLEGSGSYSSLWVYEVDETYKGIVELSVAGEYDYVTTADFYSVNQYDCYEKDGIYYYFVEDVWSGGFDSKGIRHLAYSFDDKVGEELLGEFVLHPDTPADIDLVHVYLYDSEGNIVPDEEAFNSMLDGFWDGFQKQPVVEVKWVHFPEKDNCEEFLKESYSGYKESVTGELERYDYTYFNDFYGEDTNYVIEAREPDPS